MRAAGLEDIDTYVSRQQNTVAHYIAMRPILDLCLDAEMMPGSLVQKRWWEQEVLVFPGRKSSEYRGGDGSEYGAGDRDGEGVG